MIGDTLVLIDYGRSAISDGKMVLQGLLSLDPAIYKFNGEDLHREDTIILLALGAQVSLE